MPASVRYYSVTDQATTGFTADAITVFPGGRAGITADGGFAVSLVNATGGASVKGTPVVAGSVAGSVIKSPTGSIYPIGMIYEDGIANGAACWVVVAGIAQVLLDATANATPQMFVGTSDTTAGTAYVSGEPPAASKHDQECGHTVGNGSAGWLVNAVVHWR